LSAASFVRVLNQADVLIEGGRSSKLGWLPPLVNGGATEILSDAPGHLILSRASACSRYPLVGGRSMGDVHPFGNPHFTLESGERKNYRRQHRRDVGQS